MGLGCEERGASRGWAVLGGKGLLVGSGWEGRSRLWGWAVKEVAADGSLTTIREGAVCGVRLGGKEPLVGSGWEGRSCLPSVGPSCLLVIPAPSNLISSL